MDICEDRTRMQVSAKVVNFPKSMRYFLEPWKGN